MVKSVGRELESANRAEVAVGNVVRHVLYIIRKQAAIYEETTSGGATGGGGAGVGQGTGGGGGGGHGVGGGYGGAGGAGAEGGSAIDPLASSGAGLASLAGVSGRSMYSLLQGGEDSMAVSFAAATKEAISRLKQEVIGVVDEYLQGDIKDVRPQICELAVDHVHNNEVILTYGWSRTAIAFLEHAASKRRFEVVVAESAPNYKGHEVALRLAKKGIPVTVIADSAVFAYMGRVHKVIVGAHAVLADGSLIACAGMQAVAAAAKFHSVPLVVVTGLYKCAPLFPHDLAIDEEFGSPAEVLSFYKAGGLERTEIANPRYDHVASDLVSLFLTNQGGYNASYIYKIMGDLYDAVDINL